MSKINSPNLSAMANHVQMEQSERPLIVAAYRYGKPNRKRRVKVPTNTKWKDFLSLIYSRLEIEPALKIEIYDEQGIEIVDVDDLVENDILVVRDTPPSTRTAPKSLPKPQSSTALGVWSGTIREGGRGGGELVPRLPELSGISQGSNASVATATTATAAVIRSHDKSRDPNEHSMMVSTPQLSHFIQLNSFGYYFLAEVENMKLVPTHGRIKKIHCIVKVPHCQKEAPRTFSDEADLLRKVSNHKSIVSPPSIQILNFSDDSLQHFFSSLVQQKRTQVRELFMSGGCMEAYIYPLYGVTMATRIKNGLTPDKVLKYSYQLADIMFYLQQRGVIHQNLLPENIQVMSNDRVVLCNFETAVQTNPTSCLLVSPQSVIAPGNQKGLAPEVVRSFSQLRVESESIDYSTQYPWSFGVLSAFMATGLHPLKDYPENFEGGNKVKYRSHDYQALPDSEQYPPIFCKLVKRSLSCDPIRRPTLPQILSIIKKDSKVIALMTGKRFGGPSSSTVAQQRGVSSGNGRERRNWGSMESINRCSPADAEVYGPSKDKLSKPNLPAVSSTKDFYDTHPPFAIPHMAYQPSSTNDDSASDITGYKRPSSNLHLQQLRHQLHARMESRYESQEKAASSTNRTKTNNDPFLPSQHHSDPTRRRRGQHSLWDTFGEEQQRDDDALSFFPLAAGQMDQSPPPPTTMGTRHEELTLRRHSSSGAFSDDFVLPHNISRSGSRNITQAVRRVSSASRPHGSSERLLGRSGTTSESDLSQIQEFQYHRLGHSQDERLSLFHRSDQERLLHVSSPDIDHNPSNEMNEYSYKGRHVRTHAQPSYSPDVSPRSKVARSNSYQRKTVNGKLAVESPLSMRRCLSADKSLSMRERDREENMEVTIVEPQTNKRDQPHKQVSRGETFTSENHGTPSHQHTNSNSSTGPEGILMSNSTVGNTTHTETQTTTLSLELTSQSQRGGEADVSGSEFIERMDTQSGRESSEERVILLSPVLSSTASRSQATPVSNKTFWTNNKIMVPESSAGAGKNTKGENRNKHGHYHFSEGLSHQQNHQSHARLARDDVTNDNQDEETVMISPITLHSQTGLDIFPNALSLESNPTQLIGVHNNSSSAVRTSQVPLLGEEDEELTPREDSSEQSHPQQQPTSRSEATRDLVAAWVHEDLRRIATSHAAAVPLSPTEFTAAQDDSSEGRPFYPLAHHDYSMMSPIPEASQELTSSMSMSQTNTNVHRLSGSHLRSQSRIRSVSPISEQANISGVDEQSPPPPPPPPPPARHGSVSPFQHSAIGIGNQNTTYSGAAAASEHGATVHNSNTEPQQQIVMADCTASMIAASVASGTVTTSEISSSTLTGTKAKNKQQGEHVSKRGTANLEGQPKSRSATPVMASSCVNSEEGSVSSTRGRAPHSDRATTDQSEANLSSVHPRTMEQLSGTSCGSHETSQASSARAQVTIDVSSAVRALTSSQTAHPTPSRIVSSRPQSVTNYSREPVRSSSESLGRGSQVRGTTPQSSCSAPARIQHSVDPGQRSDVTQQASSLTTTMHRHAAASMPQQHQLQHLMQLQGGGRSVAASHAQTSKRYSQQRVTELSSRSQQRIHQDIEMMHLAISGMDTTQGSGLTRSNVAAGPSGATHAPQIQGADSVTSSAAAHVQASRAMVSVESNRTFRPITPAVVDVNSRPASAPMVTAITRPSDSSTITPIPVSSATIQHPQQGTVPRQQRQPHSPSSIANVSQSARNEVASGPSSAPQPPQVSADSYDYLPPYSPPQSGGRPQQQAPERTAHPSSQQRVQSRPVSEPPLYPEPPPSYDEIFGGQSSGGRQRRRRGQRRQGGAETSNDGGNRRARSELRRSTSQNEGPIRPSASQRRLASLTNLFRRARRHTQSSSSQNQRAVQQSQAPMSTNVAVGPMDANEYVASWVESYSRTPRPVEAMEARAEAFSSLSLQSNISRAVSDITNSRTHPTTYHGSGGGAHPVPYRPPPPFPTPEGADSAVSSYPPSNHCRSQQQQSDYNLVLSHTSSDVGYSRVQRNSSQPSRPNSVAPGNRQTRPNTGNVTRRGMSREQPRRPASAIITSEVAAVNAQIQAANPGTNLVVRGSSQVESGSQVPSPQRQLSSCRGNAAHISNSCFDITSPEPVNEQQQSQSHYHQHTHEERVSSSSRQGPEAAAPMTAEREEASSPRATSECQQRSQSMSLSQGQSQGDSSNLVANVNANNINTSASPRASVTSSPINMASMIGSNSSLRQNSQPTSPAPVLEDSNTRTAVLSQPVQNHPRPPHPSSPTNCSNSESRASRSSGLSSRAAARQRAEMRLSQQDVSSSDEASSQISDRSQSGVMRRSRSRQRRRRSQGSLSQQDSVQSSSRLEVHLSPTRPADVQEEAEMNVESHATVQVQSRDNRSEVILGEMVIDRIVEEDQEVQTVEVAIEDVSEESSRNRLSLVSSGKSCGHSCEAQRQDLCCLCTVEQRAVDDSMEDRSIITALSNCSLCQRRCVSELQQTHSYNNKIHSHSQARSSPQSMAAAAGDGAAQRQRSGRNCVVM